MHVQYMAICAYTCVRACGFWAFGRGMASLAASAGTFNVRVTTITITSCMY